MAVQTKYSFATGNGIAGGIYDMYHYPIESRCCEEENGVMGFGRGVMVGSAPGNNIVLPKSGDTIAKFEGVTVNGFSNQHDLEGYVHVLKGQSVGVMKHGKIWAVVGEGVEPAYGDALYLSIGDDAGCFYNETSDTTIKVAGRFIGTADNGIAPIELYGNE